MSAMADAHRTGLGGSSAAPIMGLSSFKTVHDVYGECLGLRPETPPTLAQSVGNHCEGFIRSWYESETSQAGAPTITIRHPKMPWMIGHVDWVANDRSRFAEFKVAGLHTAKDWGEEGVVPPAYYMQCIHYAIVLGITQFDLCVMLGTEIKIYPCQYSERIAARLIDAEKAFWHDHVLAKTPPKVDGSESCTTLLKALYPRVRTQLEWAQTPEERALLRQFAETKTNYEAEEANLDELKNKLRALIGEREGIRSDGVIVKWAADKNGKRSLRATITEDAA
jgi:predicted phage-related endonuclease